MIIFKDETAHDNLSKDLELITTAFAAVTTRLAEKQLTDVIEAVEQEMACNLTVEAALKMEDLCNRHPDSGIDGMISFLVFQNAAKVESTKDFVTRTGIELDEDVVVQVRVYPDDFYIEVYDKEGLGLTHSLTLENQSWSEPETSLEAMELELFSFATVAGG